MVEIKRDLQNIRRRLLFTKFVDCFLNSLLIGVFLMGILLFFNLQFVYALVLSLIVLAVGFYRSIKKASFREIEKKVPGLRWQLRTAADSATKQNEIVTSLHQEVHDKIGFVSLFDLFSGKRTIVRVFVLVLFLAGLGYIQSADVKITTLLEGSDGTNSGNGLWDALSGSVIFEQPAIEASTDLPLGEDPGELPEGSERLEVELNAEADVVNLDELGEIESKDFKGKAFTGNIQGGQDASYEENIDSDDEVIIKRFYDLLNEA